MRLFWVVGESSGDRHAAGLIRALHDTVPAWEHAGMCGEAMRGAGCEEVADLSEVSLKGLTEVVGHLPRLLRLRDRLVEEIVRRETDIVVLVDFPDFNLNLAKAVRSRLGRNVRLLYYVSPQVWAWRKGRASQIAKLVDAMAVLFPFEVNVYTQYGLETVFFGHPLVGEVEASGPIGELREKFGLEEGQEAVALLPGSRSQEVKRLLPLQLEAVRELRRSKGESVRALVARANTVDTGLLEGMLEGFPNARIVEDGSYDALAVARAGLVKSGTSTVEAALIGTPFVVLYRVSPLTYALARTLVRGVKYIAMVNVLAGREVVTERIQHDATPANLAHDLLKVWEGPGREEVVEGLQKVSRSLGEPGATGRLARWIVRRFGETP